MITDIYLKPIIDKAAVARLATVDSECKPHLIPVVFVYDDDYYFIPIDQKSKRSKPENLKRIKNIQQNPNVALLIDEYNEEIVRLEFWYSINEVGEQERKIAINPIVILRPIVT